MARVNHKKVKQLIQQKRGKITDQEFFTSRLLALHLEDMAAAQTKRYGASRRVRVRLLWQPDNTDLAYTDNLHITINAGNPAVTEFPTREERYQMVLGLFAHELGHCLYTDFLTQQTYRNNLSACRWYPEKPKLARVQDVKNEGEFWEYAQEDPQNLALLGRVAHEISNVLEDAAMENRVLEQFPGHWAKPWILSGPGSGGKCPRSPSSRSGKPRGRLCFTASSSCSSPMGSSGS